ncbi:MAG: hypothetical protein JNN09_01050 [Alphaproteobacteria bacterium]|nr:hypothetical protein [Alphaproteobacteria bacterium]
MSRKNYQNIYLFEVGGKRVMLSAAMRHEILDPVCANVLRTCPRDDERRDCANGMMGADTRGRDDGGWMTKGVRLWPKQKQVISVKVADRPIPFGPASAMPAESGIPWS